MALHGVLRINGLPLYGYSIVRNKGQQYPMADTVCTYKWEAVRYDLDGVIEEKFEGTVEHRYGDGAPKLVSLVLAHVPPPPERNPE